MKIGDAIYWNGYSDVDSGKLVYETERDCAVVIGNSIQVKEKSSCFSSKVKALLSRAETKSKEASAAMVESARCTKLAFELSEETKDAKGNRDTCPTEG